VTTERGATVSIECPDDPQLSAYADGELVDRLPVRVTAEAGALTLLRPVSSD
jgi:diacylglycerol kinase (ATP)